MKKMFGWKIFWFGLSLIFLPLSVQCKTRAFSPSIPGQPLIFHQTKPSLTPLEKKILKKLSPDQLKQLLKISNASTKLSEGVLGLASATFLPIDNNQKQHVSMLYKKYISTSIFQIYRAFLTSEKHSSKQFAQLIKQTLVSFVETTDQMLIDSDKFSSNDLFHQDYLQMQERVINYYKAGSKKIFNESAQNSIFQAEAESALEGLVSCIVLFIANTNSIVHGDNPTPNNTVGARQEVVENLAQFVESAFALQEIYLNKKCG